MKVLLLLVIILIVLHMFTYASVDSDSMYFNTLEALKNDSWYEYFAQIYTDKQLNIILPFSVSDFEIFYTQHIPKNKKLNWSIFPKGKNTLYASFDMHLQKGIGGIISDCLGTLVGIKPKLLFNYKHDNSGTLLYFNWHTNIGKKYVGHTDYSYVEVLRGKDASESMPWFYSLKGSGIFANIGKTIAFESHLAAHKHFNLPFKQYNTTDYSRLWDNLRDKYDTVQFVHTMENVYKHEIVFLNMKTTEGACTNVPLLCKEKPCICEPNSHILKCNKI